MYTIHNQKYLCPDCKTTFLYNEWSEDTGNTQECYCDDCFDKRMSDQFGLRVGTVEEPNWKATQKKMLEHLKPGDAKFETKIAEVVQDEKQKELSSSEKARQYEKGRKDHWAKNKPEWVRRGRNTSEMVQIES